ncbi:MAG TPA: DNA/RNA non-specific endonuclease [Puia sp.]
MKKVFLKMFVPLVLLFFAAGVSAQDTTELVKIEHTYYTSYFSPSEHIPIFVNYTLTGSMLSCTTKIKRNSKFTKDPTHPDITNLNADYTRSGYDRGHNMSAQDNSCNQEGMDECFYFSNMTPQPHFFNAGVWETLEKQERTEAAQYGTVIITVGSLGKVETIGKDSVVVPKYMWKVIYIPSTKKYQCYLFPDSDDAKAPLSQYVTTLDEIQEHAGITFNAGKFVFAD